MTDVDTVDPTEQEWEEWHGNRFCAFGLASLAVMAFAMGVQLPLATVALDPEDYASLFDVYLDRFGRIEHHLLWISAAELAGAKAFFADKTDTEILGNTFTDMVEREGLGVANQAAEFVERHWHAIAMLGETVLADRKLDNARADRMLHSAFRAAAIPHHARNQTQQRWGRQ